MALLQLSGVTKRFGGITAVDGCSFAVEGGSIHGLIGPNGAGKTTLFNIVSGFVRPDRGRIRFGGTDITSLRPHRIARMGLKRTFQITRVLPELTLLENLLLYACPGDARKALALAASPLPVARATEVLEVVELAPWRDLRAGGLSYGQQKLLELGCLLMHEPRLVLMDEPMAGLSPRMVEKMVALIRRLREEAGVTFLVVEHAVPVVMELCDRVVVMVAGRVLTEGPPEVVRADPRVLEAYLGGVGAGVAG